MGVRSEKNYIGVGWTGKDLVGLSEEGRIDRVVFLHPGLLRSPPRKIDFCTQS